MAGGTAQVVGGSPTVKPGHKLALCLAGFKELMKVSQSCE